MNRSSLLAASLGLLLCGCAKEPRPIGLVERAELGIFFGGQVQEREQIPFSLDRAKQRQGFRLRFRQPLARPVRVQWEIDQPNPKGRGRIARLGELDVPAASQEVDQELAFEPGDPLGVWNVRVLVENELVIDRPFFVFDAETRKRALKESREARGHLRLPSK